MRLLRPARRLDSWLASRKGEYLAGYHGVWAGLGRYGMGCRQERERRVWSWDSKCGVRVESLAGGGEREHVPPRTSIHSDDHGLPIRQTISYSIVTSTPNSKETFPFSRAGHLFSHSPATMGVYGFPLQQRNRHFTAEYESTYIPAAHHGTTISHPPAWNSSELS